MPSAAQFDTLRYVEKLISAGMPETQAKAGAEALAVAFHEWGSGFLAAKSDISDLRYELKGEISDLRIELKGEIGGLRTEFKCEIAAVKLEQADMKSDIKLMKWMLGVLLAGTGSLMAGVGTVAVKLFF